MKNIEISKILGESGFLLEMDNEVTDKKITNANIFKARSYKRASELHIPSVGKAIASRIEEYLITGK